MANVGITFGGDILVYRNTGTEQSPVWAAIAHATNHSYSASTAMREVAHKDDGGHTAVRPGRHAPATISISGLVSYDGVDFWDLESLRLAKTKLLLKYGGRPAADPDKVEHVELAGDHYYKASGYLSEVSREDPVDGDSTYSATITLDGKPVESTVAGS